ncbi:MAG: hypothetical protein LBK53_01420 [Heliobacteriaceae bacterium]|jgi:hypothetical protein|nr:hypothetical protein [Heliobacteriaceae bacterium]
MKVLKINSVGKNFSEIREAKKGMSLLNVPLKDKSTAKVFYNNEQVDYYEVRSGKVIDETHFQKSGNAFSKLLEDLQEKAQKGVDVVSEFLNSSI